LIRIFDFIEDSAIDTTFLDELRRGFDIARAPHHSAAMLWILFIVLSVFGGAAATGMLLNEKRRKALPGGSLKSLPAQAGDVLAERGLRDLRAQDVITIDGRDFLCEGVLHYDEDGHQWICGRVVDGSEEQWLLVGIERTGGNRSRLLKIDASIAVSGYPPESLLVDDIRFALDKRGNATCKMTGDVGALGDMRKDRLERHAERCRWWLYSADAQDSILIEQFGADYRCLRGKKIGLTTIELIPGS
jgi:hypothetical protein